MLGECGGQITNLTPTQTLTQITMCNQPQEADLSLRSKSLLEKPTTLVEQR